MKKKILISCLAVFGAAIVVVLVFVIYGFATMTSPDKTTMEKEIIILNQTYPSDIIVYGDDILFDKTLNYRKIVEINEDELASENYQYRFIVVNNLSGNINVTKQEADLISSCVKNDRYVFIYMGKPDSQVFIESGLLEQEVLSACRGFYTGYLHGVFLRYGVEIASTQDVKDFNTYPNLVGSLLITTMVKIINTEH